MDSNDLHQHVLDFIAKHDLLHNTPHLMLAVSGGADSMGLLYVLYELIKSKRLACELVCVNLNHQLRGEAAESDAEFVRLQTQKLGLPFISARLAVRREAKIRKLSLETAGRQLRLQKLMELAEENECSAIATGHHLDDNVETIVFRLLRGTGYRGLAGIHPMKVMTNGVRIIRPLLCLSRANIQEYLQVHRHSWREDATNQDVIHKRNFIRHCLLPALNGNSPTSLSESLAALAQEAYCLQQRTDKTLTSLWTEYIEHQDSMIQIPCSVLQGVPPWIQIACLQRILETVGCGLCDIDQTHYRTLQMMAQEGIPRHHILPQGFEARRIKHNLHFQPPTINAPAPPNPPAKNLSIPGSLRWGSFILSARFRNTTPTQVRSFMATKTSHVEWLDLDSVSGPLTLRARQPGDRFTPLGSQGSRKVGKFLTDAKLPVSQKHQIVIVADQEKIIWVAPIRLSDQVKLGAGTRRILELEFRTA